MTEEFEIDVINEEDIEVVNNYAEPDECDDGGFVKGLLIGSVAVGLIVGGIAYVHHRKANKKEAQAIQLLEDLGYNVSKSNNTKSDDVEETE